MEKRLSRWQILKIIRQHGKLSEERHPLLTQNKVAKIFGYVMIAFTVFYLMFFAFILAMIANESRKYTAAEVMFGIIPFVILIDFFSRFALQQTPAQLIKPYVLLPIDRYVCIDCFLFNSVTSLGNLVWMAMFVPFAIMSIVFVEGFWAAIAFLLAAYLVILINSQWYLLSRTLINRSFYWWGLPLAVFALMAIPLFISGKCSFKTFFETYATIGEGAAHWSPLVFGGLLALLALLLFINRRVQAVCVYDELSKNEVTKIKHVSQLQQFDRFGEVGEYLKIEVKSIMRNKNIRKGFISATILIVVFSLLIAFTDVYGKGMSLFLVVYNFAIFGAIILNRVMCYEGNYIDCLMVRKENIISLLKAKYFIYSSLLVLPLLLMLPIVFTGKFSLLALLAVMALTAGPVHAAFLYMAIFNKQTMPLNTKFIGKGSMENNFLQIGIQMAAFTLPLLLMWTLPLLLGDTLGYLIVMAIGIAVIALHRYWIRDIYRRLMNRRYENLESLRASR